MHLVGWSSSVLCRIELSASFQGLAPKAWWFLPPLLVDSSSREGLSCLRLSHMGLSSLLSPFIVYLITFPPQGSLRILSLLCGRLNSKLDKVFKVSLEGGLAFDGITRGRELESPKLLQFPQSSWS